MLLASGSNPRKQEKGSTRRMKTQAYTRASTQAEKIEGYLSPRHAHRKGCKSLLLRQFVHV